MFGPGKITAFFVMAFAAILLAAPASAAGVSVKFNSRDPATCTPAQLSGAMTPALARQAFICDTEGLTRTMGVTQSGLTLVANVTITSMKAARYEDLNLTFEDADRRAPGYFLKGSFDDYACSPVPPYSIGVPGHNCSRTPQPKATGYCYRKLAGYWQCYMSDTVDKAGDMNVAPPPAR